MVDRWERLFTWVWRVNGLLLLGLGVAGMFGVAALAFSLVSERVDRADEPLTQVAGAELVVGDLRLRDFDKIEGTGFLYTTLDVGGEFHGVGSGSGPSERRNLLFFDLSSRKAHWLLPDNEHVIESYAFLTDPPDRRTEGEERQTIGLLLELRARGSETETLAIASGTGRELTPIASSVSTLLGHHQARADSAFVFYSAGGTARVLELDVKSRNVRSDEPLATEDGR